MQRVAFQALYDEFYNVLTEVGFPDQRAALCAKLFAENQRDGVYSHGLNRFPGFVESMKQKKVDFRASPEKIKSLGAREQWDGKRGVGLVNAHACMQRATELAQEHGMGGIGLKNTNHWMRAGAYALQAAQNNCVGICWTNTMPLMPPWGSAEKKIGNNPTGTIVSWREDGLVPCDKNEDELVMGVIKQGKDEPIVMGAEPVLVTGKVDIGDYIVTSDKIGHGKSVKRGYLLKKNLFGKVIAQALEKSDDSDSCLIKCMIRKM